MRLIASARCRGTHRQHHPFRENRCDHRQAAESDSPERRELAPPCFDCRVQTACRGTNGRRRQYRSNEIADEVQESAQLRHTLLAGRGLGVNICHQRRIARHTLPELVESRGRAHHDHYLLERSASQRSEQCLGIGDQVLIEVPACVLERTDDEPALPADPQAVTDLILPSASREMTLTPGFGAPRLKTTARSARAPPIAQPCRPSPKDSNATSTPTATAVAATVVRVPPGLPGMLCSAQLDSSHVWRSISGSLPYCSASASTSCSCEACQAGTKALTALRASAHSNPAPTTANGTTL